MRDQSNDFWFYAKSFGWGWGLPAKWQGWVVFVLYAALLFGGRFVFLTPRYLSVFVIGITVLLVAVVAWKGEKPLKWRWGGL